MLGFYRSSPRAGEDHGFRSNKNITPWLNVPEEHCALMMESLSRTVIALLLVAPASVCSAFAHSPAYLDNENYWDVVGRCGPFSESEHCGFCLSTLECLTGTTNWPIDGSPSFYSWKTKKFTCPVVLNYMDCQDGHGCVNQDQCSSPFSQNVWTAISEATSTDCHGLVFEPPRPSNYISGFGQALDGENTNFQLALGATKLSLKSGEILEINGGDKTSFDGVGGDVSLAAGSGQAKQGGSGGSVVVQGGDGIGEDQYVGGVGVGGEVKVQAGSAVQGSGGSVDISVGSSTLGLGGVLEIKSGRSSAITTDAVVIRTAHGRVSVLTGYAGPGTASGMLTLRSADAEAECDNGALMLASGSAISGETGDVELRMGTFEECLAGDIVLAVGTSAYAGGGTIALTAGDTFMPGSGGGTISLVSGTDDLHGGEVVRGGGMVDTVNGPGGAVVVEGGPSEGSILFILSLLVLVIFLFCRGETLSGAFVLAVSIGQYACDSFARTTCFKRKGFGRSVYLCVFSVVSNVLVLHWLLCFHSAAAAVCRPPGLQHLDNDFWIRGHHACHARADDFSLILSLEEREGFTLSEICMFEPVPDFFGEDGMKIRLSVQHGYPPFQRAKSILFIWMHMYWAHLYGYQLIFAINEGAFPAKFIEEHRSACLHFVVAPRSDLAVFNVRYDHLQQAMLKHPTKYVVHDDLDSEVLKRPFTDDGRLVIPAGVGEGISVNPCYPEIPDIVFQANEPFIDPKLRISNDYFKQQMETCFGDGIFGDGSPFPFWLTGQLSGEYQRVLKVVNLTIENIRNSERSTDSICDMAAITKAARTLVQEPAAALGSDCNPEMKVMYVPQGSLESGVHHSHAICYVYVIYKILIGRGKSGDSVEFTDEPIKQHFVFQTMEKMQELFHEQCHRSQPVFAVAKLPSHIEIVER